MRASATITVALAWTAAVYAGAARAGDSGVPRATAADAAAAGAGAAAADAPSVSGITPNPVAGETAVIPAVLDTPETGFGAGAGLVYIAPKKKEKVSSVVAGCLYTQKKQFLSAVYSEQYFADDKFAAELFGSFQQYPDEFFGIGNATRVADQEDYRWDQNRGAFTLRYLFSKDFRAGIQGVDEIDSFHDLAQGGQLASGRIYGVQGGTSRGLGLTARYDSLDDAYTPSHGSVANLGETHYAKSLGSQFVFDSYELNLKHFHEVAPGTVLAGQIYGLFETGDPPFFELGELGGKNLLRGYYLGRYRDRDMLVAQGEVRQVLWGRLGGVVFAGAGEVAHDPENLTASAAKPSEGFGFRWQLTEKQKTNVRLDFGFAPHESNPSTYLYILEAF